MSSLYDMFASVFRPPEQPDPYGMLAGALKADPEGASGFADLAGRSREARAAAGVVTAPVGALDYMGKTLRGEEDLRDPVTGGFTNEAYGAAGTLAGVGMTGGIAGTGPGGVALGAGPIRAYHGTPHDFDRFELSKIGTGEGAQAQGYGLYFAEKEGVARSYRDALSSTPQSIVNSYQKKYGGRIDSAIRDLEDSVKAYRMVPEGHPFRTQRLPEVESDLRVLQDYRALGPSAGRMYEVNIHSDPDRFLAWDRPLTEQPRAVRELAADPGTFPPGWDTMGGLYEPGDLPPMRGRDVVGGLRARMSPAEVSRTLEAAGVPGTRYLDQVSRNAGTGSSNYVVFDPATIEILRKYGFLGPLIAGAATASMPDTARK